MSTPEETVRIPVIRGKLPRNYEKEFLEMSHYESGKAELDAREVQGPYDEPWLNVVNLKEPVSIPAFEKIISHEFLRKKIRGKVLDIAAGSCWMTARLSQLPEVKEVYAVDLSEKFLQTSGVRCMKSLEADLSKVRLVPTDFNELPFEDSMADCALLFAALHHSLSPIKTLQEVGRCIKPGGCIMILENPPAAIKIRETRERCLKMSDHVSEVAHTREELEYLMKVANIGKITVFTFDILSRPGWRFQIRKIFRRLNIEHLILNPPTYLFLIEKS